MAKRLRILFTGGGSGGHIMPIIAIARELRRLYSRDHLTLYYVGPKDATNAFLLSQEYFQVNPIASGKIRRYFSLANITDVLFTIPFGFLQSFFLLMLIRPQVVVSKGGSGSFAVALAALLLGRPIFLHESDSIPGTSNKIVSKWATKVFTSFSQTEYFDLSKTMLVGNPIKQELIEGNQRDAKEIFHLSLEKPILLFFGGSQGAQAINEFLLSVINELLPHYEIIHACGENNYKKVLAETQAVLQQELQKDYHLYSSLNEVELKHAYKAANFIVARAGSGSIFEIAAVGKPSILVPLPSAAGDHQSKNAYQYAQTGAAIVMEQGTLTPNFFIKKIDYLLSSPQELERMSQAALQFAKPLAAKAIARELLEYLHAY